MDTRIGCAHPARTPCLPPAAALRSVPCAAGLRLLPKARTNPQEAEGKRQKPVTREEFKQLVDEALETIPDRFRDAMQNIAIVIEDEPPASRPLVLGLIN